MFATRTICFWRAKRFMGETQLPSCLISRHGWATFLAPNVGQRIVPLDLVPCPKKRVILDRAPMSSFKRFQKHWDLAFQRPVLADLGCLL